MSYYKLLDTLKAQLNATNLINTVTDGQISDVDLNKQTLFPLAHIIVNQATIEGKLQRFNVSILAMDILDGKEKYDVEPSIMNAMLQALNRVYEVMTRGDLNPDYIMIDGTPNLEPFTDRFENKLAGWAMTFDVIMMSEMTVCDTGFTSGCPNVTITDGDETIQVLAGGTYICEGGSVELNVSNSNDTYSVTTSENLELPNIQFTDSDGTVTSVPSVTDIVATPQIKDIFIKGIFAIGNDTMETLTIDSDTEGTYTSITDDGSSGTITLSKNGGAFGAFSSPFVLVATDTLVVKRTVTTAIGNFKLIGTYV